MASDADSRAASCRPTCAAPRRWPRCCPCSTCGGSTGDFREALAALLARGRAPPQSGRDARDDARRGRCRWDDTRQPEAARREELAVLRLGPLHTAREREHLKVEKLPKREHVERRDHGFHDEEPRARL